MKLQDLRRWLTEDTWNQVEKIINMKSSHKRLYYIQVQLQSRYTGPATANEHLPVKEIKLKAEKVMGRRMVLFNCPLAEKGLPLNGQHEDVCQNECQFGQAQNNMLDLPVGVMCPRKVAQLGTILIKVDNRDGVWPPPVQYVLPQDLPTAREDSDNEGEVVPLVAESISKRRIELMN